MNKRRKEILAAVIEEYTNSAVPVGSKILVENYDFDISPATMRSDLNKLTEDGFLHQPHISAGRIPTDKGYKYFVEEIMGDEELSLMDQKKLQAELLKLRAQNQRLSRTTAKLLSGMSGNLAISTIEKDFSEFGIRELLGKPEFKEMDEFCKVAEALDFIDENVDSILKELKSDETRIFIGEDNPIKGIANCSMVVSPYKTKSGQKGVLAIIGPKRMKYAENKSLLDYVRKLLSAGAVLVLAVIVI
jgi:transcriptional regulator of heat shock response